MKRALIATKRAVTSLALLLPLFASWAVGQNSLVIWSTFDMAFAVPTSANSSVKSAVGQLFVDGAQQTNTRVLSGLLADTLLQGNVTTGVDEMFTTPLQFSLSQNYPNPFNPATSIRLEIPYRTRVELSVYNLLGQRIAILLSEEKEPGRYVVVWNGRSDAGAQVGSGVFFYRLQTDQYVQTKSLLVLR